MAYEIRIAGSEVQFACDAGQTVLDAALQAGIGLPYSCRKGVCGNCAGTVAQGTFTAPPPNEATPPGQQLLCQCVPSSDLAIVPESWHRIDPAARKTFSAKVFRNTLAAPDVSVLQLRLPAGKRAKFKAGQYLQVLLADGSRRSYSMANPPHESDMLQLHVRHVPGGRFSQVVAGLKSGDVLEVELPYGSFELQEDRAAPMLCVAGGTGFAPVKSLLDDLVKRRIERAVTLVWGGRDAGGLYLMDAVARWQKVLPGFRFVPVLEDAAAAQALQGFHGRVDAAIRASVETLAGHEVYCCGSPAMVAAVKKACVDDKGLDPHRFFSDVFVDGPAVG